MALLAGPSRTVRDTHVCSKYGGTDALLPFCSYIAKTGAFFENHGSGLGTNSTPNHQMIVGGQAMTLKNPPHGAAPVWDVPSVAALAARSGMTWKGYTGAGGYPLQFYQDLAATTTASTCMSRTSGCAGVQYPREHTQDRDKRAQPVRRRRATGQAAPCGMTSRPTVC
jgi:hypothetical protein